MTKALRPKSATGSLTGFAGLTALALTIWIMKNSEIAAYQQSLVIVGASVASMIAVEILLMRTHRKETTGINWDNGQLNLARSALKCLGLFFTLSVLAGLYALFPEYKNPLYQPFWDAIRLLLPYAAVFSVCYIVIIDSFMTAPQDGYYHAGLLALGQWGKADKKILVPHARTWLIKGFFIPLMFAFLTSNMNSLPQKMTDIAEGFAAMNMVQIFAVFWFTLLTIDLIFTVAGYVFSFRAIDSHERSSEPTMLGWTVALFCYKPFWDLFEKHYLPYGKTTPKWQDIYASHPLIVTIWGGGIILLTAIYAWSTVAFGLRFSNLTHRGIITNGPYAFTKHPAYISKNLSWWMLSVPFLALIDNPALAIKSCIMLLMLNGIYYLRAITEERHLSADPVYREYQSWIRENGIFRKFRFGR